MNTSEKLAHCITTSQDSFTYLLAGIPEEQATLKAGPEKWSVLECVEHIYLVEKSIAKLLLRPNADEQKLEETGQENFGAEKMRHILSNRDRKYSAPGFFVPKNTFSSLEEAKTAVTGLRTELIQALKEGKISFNNITFPHPVMGDFTRLDWVNFLIEHAARHYKQLDEIRHETGKAGRN